MSATIEHRSKAHPYQEISTEMLSKNQPIGIFDSGIGGLTVAYAVKKLLPNEQLIYFGDTAHLPYGDKSTAAIQAYSVKICDVLLKQNCKLILIACNSASAAAFELVKAYVGSKALVMNVIDPVIKHLSEYHNGTKVGLIGTRRTINSNIYKKRVDETNLDIELKSLATPLLAPMIEDGFFNNNISRTLINEYLSNEELKGIQSLILGCTHYPLIKTEINDFYQQKVNVIDSSEIVAESLQEVLGKKNLLNPTLQASDKFFVSDFTRSFVESTRIFFRQEVGLELYPIWD
jgi:glutamate racemase